VKLLRLSEVIARSPEEVFAYMLDFRTAQRWRSLIVRMEPLEAGPLRPGLRIRLTYQFGGRERQQESELVIYEPPRRYALRSRNEGVSAYFDYTVEPHIDGARVTMDARIEAHDVYSWLLLPLARRSARRRLADQLVKLKRAVEGDPEWVAG
jgi:hypothetical protein